MILDISSEFLHIYVPRASAQVTHGVEIRGLFSPLFGFLIGHGVKKHLRTAMLKLVEKAIHL